MYNSLYKNHEIVYGSVVTADLISSLITDKAKCILDVGCGRGTLGKKIKEKFPNIEIYGIDISQKALEEAKKYYDFVSHCNLEQLVIPFKKKFDVIVFGDILEHLSNPLVILEFFKDHLKNDGNIIVSIPNIAYWKIRLKLLLGKFEYQKEGILDSSHLRFFTDKSFLQLLDVANLKSEKLLINYFRPVEKSLARFIPSAKNLFAYQLIYKIVKN